MFVGFQPSKVVFRISQPSTVSQISLNIGIFWHFLKKNKLMVDTKQSRMVRWFQIFWGFLNKSQRHRPFLLGFPSWQIFENSWMKYFWNTKSKSNWEQRLETSCWTEWDKMDWRLASASASRRLPRWRSRVETLGTSRFFCGEESRRNR